MARGLRRILLAACLPGLLAACATDADFRRADEASCASYGFTPGSDGFAACLQRESLARRYQPPPAGFYGWYGAGFYSFPPFGVW